MAHPELDHSLRVEFQTRDCTIPPDERARMQAGLRPLAEAVEDFPSADLRLKVNYHPHRQAYHVEANLRLPGVTLFTGEWDSYLDPALQRCVRKLVWKVAAYQKDPDRDAQQR